MMFKKLGALLAIFILSLLAGQATALAADIPFIVTDDLKKKMDAGEPLVLADALSSIEHNELAIKGSVNIPASRVAGNPNLPADKGMLLIFYCKGPKCGKSRIAAEEAVKLGYSKVMVYNEGLPEWAKRGFEVVSKTQYPKVEIARMSPKEVFDQKASLVLVDIRGEKHMDLGKIDGTVNILLDDMEEQYTKLPKDKKLLLLDHAGKQLAVAAKFLHMKGYTNVAIMDGGVTSWIQAGLPVSK
ncbi:rhodanese-like domain-containing protein [Thiovibrio sp. JS02]